MTEPQQTGLCLYIGHPDLANFDSQYTPALARDFIDGAAVMVQWQEIEPQPGVYDFTYFDKWILPTLTLKTKLSLGVVAGIFTPQWIYGPGYNVPVNTFQYDRSETGTGGCTTVTQPSFWKRYILDQVRQDDAGTRGPPEGVHSVGHTCWAQPTP